MAKTLYSLGDAYVIGEREHYEDAVNVETGLQTAGGLTLEVAIVCDGVGGRHAGEVAAQTAVSTALTALRSSNETHVPTLLRQTVEQANREVNRQGNGGKCTLALAVVVRDGSPFGRLYIASVGDSRIGMVRTVDKDNRLHDKRSIAWLNRLHNVAEDQIAQGIDPQLAYREHNAHSLTRVLGLYDRIEVDQGFYYNAPDVATAQQRGEDGLALRTADTIMVCSDGMLDRSPIDREPVVSDEKFIRHTLDTNAKDASSILVSIAQGRKTQDNASLGMIIVDPQSRYRRTTVPSRVPRVVLGASAALAVVAFVLLGLYINSTQQGDVVAQSLTQANETLTVVGNNATQAFVETAQAVASFTATFTPAPTLTPTALPTIAAGAVGKHWSASQADAQFKSNDILGSTEFSIVEIWGKDPSFQSHAYISKDGSLKVSSVDQTSGSLALQSEVGDFLVRTGSFNQLSTRLRGSSVEFGLSGSCMIVNNDPAQVSMACLEGKCSYTTTVGEFPVDLPVGKKIVFSKDQSTPQTVPIVLADVTEYLNNMEKIGGQTGLIDLNECGLRKYLPVPTKVPATPQPVKTQATTPGTNPQTQTCTGNLVPQGNSCGCPQGMVRNGDQCTAPLPTFTPKPPTAAPPPPPTSVPSCGGGQVWSGSACVCPSGKLWNGNSCDVPACSGGQSWDGDSCECTGGKKWDGDSCENPVPACSGGQSWDGDSCECTGGQTWDGDSCENPVQTCSGGQVLSGGVCVDPPCPDGKKWDGDSCEDPPAPPSGGGTRPIEIHVVSLKLLYPAIKTGHHMMRL